MPYKDKSLHKEKILQNQRQWYLKHGLEYFRKWQSENRDKVRKASNKWKYKNEDRRISYMLRWRYGVTSTDYDRLFILQKGRCAICFSFGTAKRRLALDHNHKTGTIRGLLCNSCNTGIGHFRDNTSLLNRAKTYLQKYATE